MLRNNKCTSVTFSKPYFEMKAKFNQLLEEQRKKVHHLEENVLKVKMSYADALHNLEEISDEIHLRRQQLYEPNENKRSQGVGAESPEASNSFHQNPKSHLAIGISPDELCDDIYDDDSYKSLPANYGPRVVVPEEFLNPSQVLHDEDESAPMLNQAQRENKQGACTSVARNFMTDHLAKNITSLSDEVCSVKAVANKIKQLTLKSDLGCQSSKLLSSQVDRSPDGAEISNQRHHAIDLNILRVQKEDVSDSESLASNDTADTLDDSQIECLLLDRVLSSDYQDSLSLGEQTRTESE